MSLLVAEELEVRLPTGGGGGVPPAMSGRDIFSGVDLSLSPGDLRAVVGPSGSGKTTLLRALAGLTPLSSGAIALHGRGIGEWPPSAWRRQVGMLPQRPVMFPGTVGDNLSLPSTLRSASLAAATDLDPGTLLDALGLGHRMLDRPANELSEGQIARVGLARALLAGPAVILLDEPTAALDGDAADSVEQLLRQRAAVGLAVLWVLHEPARAGALPVEPLVLAPQGGD